AKVRSGQRRCQHRGTATARSRAYRPRWQQRWRDRTTSACESALTRLAGGVFTTLPRLGPSGGATTAPAATAREYGEHGQHKSEAPDNEFVSVARHGKKSNAVGSCILGPDEC